MNFLLVQVPQNERATMAGIWNHARESVIDSDTQLRLHRNGIRTGVTRIEWWRAVQKIIESIEGRRISQPEPIRIPPGFPLGLELDSGARDRTLFMLASDGILTGQTWPGSRIVLRLVYALRPSDPGGVWLEVVPEVRQRLPGTELVRTPSGLTEQPRYAGLAYSDAGFAVRLEPPEILMIAPNENSRVFGIIGGGFLTDTQEEQVYDSYIFLRADVNYGDRRG